MSRMRRCGALLLITAVFTMPAGTLCQSWSPPMRVSTDFSNGFGPGLTVDTLGVVWCAWVPGPFIAGPIHVSHFSGGEWSDPDVVPAPPGRFFMNPTLTTDANGNIWAVGDDDGGVYASFYDGISWSNAMEVPTGLSGGPASTAIGDGSGNLWVTWTTLGRTVCSNCYDGNQWGIPAKLPVDTAAENVNYSLAVDHDGVVWSGWMTFSSGGRGGLYTSHRDNGNWGEPKLIDSLGGTGPALVSDSSGRMWGAWRGLDGAGGSNVYVGIYEDSLWSPRRLIGSGPDSTGVCFPRMAAGRDGRIWLCFDRASNGDYDVFACCYDGSEWTNPLPVDTHPAYDNEPAIVADDSGRIWIAWTSRRDGDHAIYASYTYGVGVEEEQTTYPPVSGFSLNQNRPNPFKRSTQIRYTLPTPCQVDIRIFGVTGRLVEALVNETQQPGIHQVRWDRITNPSGVYFYRLEAGEFTSTKKMVVVE
jgi:hypothetical protein